MELKSDLPAMMVLLATIILAVGYSFYKSVKEYQKPNYELCPLCNQKVTIKI